MLHKTATSVDIQIKRVCVFRIRKTQGSFDVRRLPIFLYFAGFHNARADGIAKSMARVITEKAAVASSAF